MTCISTYFDMFSNNDINLKRGKFPTNDIRLAT